MSHVASRVLPYIYNTTILHGYFAEDAGSVCSTYWLPGWTKKQYNNDYGPYLYQAVLDLDNSTVLFVV